MPSCRHKTLRTGAALLAALAAASCAKETVPLHGSAQASPNQCLAAGDGRLQATLRGALVADLDWRDAQMQCDGGPRPDGEGLRVAIAGPLPATATSPARTLRFIFGIGLDDRAAGEAQVLPTNLTVLVEGEALLYATRGDDKCAVEGLERSLVQPGVERVSVRGYCLGPASDLAGETRVLVPTFSFTALARRDAQEGVEL